MPDPEVHPDSHPPRRSGTAHTANWLVVPCCVLAWGLCLTAFGMHWDRRALSDPEAQFAAGAWAPLEREHRTGPLTPPQRVLLTWAVLTTGTERSLRALMVLSLLGAAVLLSVTTARSGGYLWVPLLVGLHPWTLRFDLLQPELLLPLPAALATGTLVWARSGDTRWWVAATLGVVGAGLLDPMAGLATAVGSATLPWFVTGGHRRPWLVAVSHGAAVAWLWWQTGAPDLSATESPGSLGSFFGYAGPRAPSWMWTRWAAWVIPAAVLVAVRPPYRTRTAVATLGLAAAWAVPWTPAPLGESGAAWLASTLPFLVVAATVALDQLRSPWGGAAFVALSAMLGWSAWDAQEQRNPPGHPRGWLSEVREAATPGGRLILTGPHRLAPLFDVWRGRDPLIPVLLVPEDAAYSDLAEILRERLGIRPGEETTGPPIFLHPARPDPPPGFAIIPWTDQVVRLQLLPP